MIPHQIPKKMYVISFFILICLACNLPSYIATEMSIDSPKQKVETAIDQARPNLKETILAAGKDAREGIQNFKTLNAPMPTQGTLPLPDYTPAKGNHMVGEVVNSGQLSWSVLRWNVIQEPFMPSKTLLVDVLTINRSQMILYIPNNFTQKDKKGQDTYATGGVNLAPGERVRRRLTFYIDNEPNLVILDADKNSGRPSARIIWELGPVPVETAAPPIQTGEKIEKVYKVGESCRLGNLEIKVTRIEFPESDRNLVPGYRYVAADIVFKNKGSQDFIVDDNLSAWIKDRQDFEYGEYFIIGCCSFKYIS